MKIFSKEKITSLLSSDKLRVALVFIGLSAILLIFLSGSLFSKDSTDTITNSLSSTDYQINLTDELVTMIESIKGAGKARVLLTLESSYEYIYLDDDKTLAKILEPKIRGVAVACTGGDDPVVKEKVTSILTTVLSVSPGNISVSKLN
ncbi:MAG: hypothetical protein IJZ54_02555 [Clostridia bacterium]|nr:hypothetical protein [Clostridia bacterium]